MDPILLFLTLLFVPGILIVARYYYKKRRRQHVINQVFLPEWESILKENIPLYKHLPSDLQRQLKELILIFIDEKSFFGFQGLEVTDEMQITIAAQACILLLNRKTNYYSKLSEIYIYPTTFVSKETYYNEVGIAEVRESPRLGESWGSGKIVLAWDAVLSGGKNINDGQNVTMHEFAHQLDSEDGKTDGAPTLGDSSKYASWAKVLGREFKALCQKRGRSVMDKYGTTDPAEFFAVATETFFEKPKQLEKQHKELYGVLRDFYKVDPISWP